MKNNKTLAFLALIFVALFSYWTFNQVKFYRDKNAGKSFENLPDTSSSSTQNLNDNNTADKVNSTISSGSNTSGDNIWVATDYKQGDISKGNYTVKSGDTLWEIAEAVYGDGTQWVNILHVNSTSVDYLLNGQQALIFPGQVLVIP